jgi:hypothetical protein
MKDRTLRPTCAAHGRAHMDQEWAKATDSMSRTDPVKVGQLLDDLADTLNRNDQVAWFVRLHPDMQQLLLKFSAMSISETQVRLAERGEGPGDVRCGDDTAGRRA